MKKAPLTFLAVLFMTGCATVNAPEFGRDSPANADAEAPAPRTGSQALADYRQKQVEQSTQLNGETPSEREQTHIKRPAEDGDHHGDH